MSRGVAPPNLGLPGVGDLCPRITIPIGLFEGTTSNWTQRVSSSAQSFTTLQNLPHISTNSLVNLYVLWSSEDSSTTDTVTWRLQYAALTVGTDVMTKSVAALTTAIAAQATNGTANTLQRTLAGQIGSGLIGEGNLLKLTLDIPTVSGIVLASTVVNAHAVELEFMRAVI